MIWSFLNKVYYPCLESNIFSTDDILYHFDEWIDSKINVLYITGLSGSGKTTLAKQICEQCGSNYFELDRIEHYKDYLYKDTNRIDELLLKKYFELNHESRDVNLMDDKEYGKFFMDAYLYLYDYTTRHKNARFVFEGIQIAGRLYDRPELFESAIIIKETSIDESIQRRKNRDGKMLLNGIERTDAFMYDWYINAYKWVLQLKNEIDKRRK